jgi:hypothetical protein
MPAAGPAALTPGAAAWQQLTRPRRGPGDRARRRPADRQPQPGGPARHRAAGWLLGAGRQRAAAGAADHGARVWGGGAAGGRARGGADAGAGGACRAGGGDVRGQAGLLAEGGGAAADELGLFVTPTAAATVVIAANHRRRHGSAFMHAQQTRTTPSLPGPACVRPQPSHPTAAQSPHHHRPLHARVGNFGAVPVAPSSLPTCERQHAAPPTCRSPRSCMLCSNLLLPAPPPGRLPRPAAACPTTARAPSPGAGAVCQRSCSGARAGGLPGTAAARLQEEGEASAAGAAVEGFKSARIPRQGGPLEAAAAGGRRDS